MNRGDVRVNCRLLKCIKLNQISSSFFTTIEKTHWAMENQECLDWIKVLHFLLFEEISADFIKSGSFLTITVRRSIKEFSPSHIRYAIGN